MRASFGFATGGALTIFFVAPPNGPSVWVRVLDEVLGPVPEEKNITDLPAYTQFLSSPLFINNGSAVAAVAYDSAGMSVGTDY